MNTPPPLPKCSHTAFWVVIGVLGFVLMLSIFVNTGLMFSALAKSASGSLTDGQGEDEFPKLTETWSYGTGETKAARIPVQGFIFRNGETGFLGTRYDPVEMAIRQIRAAGNDEDVKAIILEVDSPGGDLTATDEIYDELLRFRQSNPDRKIVTFVQGMAASGGYYVSMPADWILAEPTAIVGSIGVIMQTLNFKGLSEKLGITDTTIKSGENKDLLNPFHAVSTQQVALLQTVVDDSYERFLKIVLDGRNIEEAKLRAIADGRILSANAALEQGLIDQIGYWPDAATKAAELLGVESLKIIRYQHKPTFMEILSSAHTPVTPATLLSASMPRLMYLWKP